MNIKDTGGSAFPWGEHGTVLGGMDLRDYFAAKAMPEVIVALMHRAESVGATETMVSAADISYGYADAMIAERKKG